MIDNETPVFRKPVSIAIRTLSIVVLLSIIGCATTKPSAQEQLGQQEQEPIERPEAEEAAKEAEKKTVEALKAVQLACEAYAVDWGCGLRRSHGCPRIRRG